MSTLAENIFPVPPNKLVDPVTVKDPLITVDPVIVVFVFTLNPVVGLIEAVALPLAIWDKFNPTMLEADIFVNPLPLPWNEPLNDPLNNPVPIEAKDEV